jgi:RNA polymerase sigma-70 factor (ECF subfamily)
LDAQEAALHRRLLERDPTALDLLIEAYSSQVYRIAGLVLGQLGNPQDVEEAAGDAFAAVWERAAEYDPQRSTFKNWVLMLAKYAALNRRRALLREEARVIPLEAAVEPSQEITPEDDLIRRDRRDRLRQALARLPEADRELLVRRYFLEQPIVQLARELGLTRAAIDNRLWRARQALRALLTEEREGYGNGASAI